MSNYRPGIYKITCNVDGRVYVGKSVVIGKRWASHRQGVQEAHDRHHRNPGPDNYPDSITNSLVRHGLAQHKFEVIEFVDDVERLNERERYWIDALGVMDQTRGFNRA